MKKSIFKKAMAVLLSAVILTPVYSNVSMAAVSADASSGSVAGDYVVIVNTDPANTESSGTLVFDDDTAGTASTQSASEYEEKLPAEDELTPVSDILSEPLIAAQTAASYEIGDTISGNDSKTYVCIGIGTYCYVWMEATLKASYDTAGITSSAAAEMAAVYDGSPHEVLNMLAGGSIPYGDGSGKLSIMLETMSGSVAGYYGGEDTITTIHIKAQDAASFYTGYIQTMSGLLVHEGQHALFHRMTCGGDAYLAYKLSWINEGISVLAMDYATGGDSGGWLSNINDDTVIGAGMSLVYQDYRQTTSGDYSMPFLYARYLADQLSGGYDPEMFLRSVYQLKITDLFQYDTYGNPVNEYPEAAEIFVNALLAKNGSSMTFRESLSYFYAAAIAQEASGVYGFYKDPAVFTKVTSYPVYTGSSGSSVELAGTSAIVVKTVNGAFQVPTDGGSHIRYIGVSRNTTALAPSGGSGTQEAPYLISKADEMSALAAFPDAYFEIAADIDLSDMYYITVSEFSGTLDGGDHQITGLSAPLVGSNTGVIKNLRVTASIERDCFNYAGVIAEANYYEISNVRVHGVCNIRLYGTINPSVSYGMPVWGTIAGYNDTYMPISNCSSDADVTVKLIAGRGYVGGLVGEHKRAIKDSYVQGSLAVIGINTGSGPIAVGGLAGHISAAAGWSNLTNDYSTADITLSAADSQKGSLYVGRLCGLENTDTTTAVKIPVNNTYGLSGMAMSGSSYAFDEAACSKTAVQLKTHDTFKGWDFTNIWYQGEDSYPIFIADKGTGAPSPKDVSDIFEDVKDSDWFHDSVQYVYDRLIMTGMKKTEFGPEVNLSRSQFATILYRLEGSPAAAYTAQFPDVPDGEFYSLPATWASNERIITGYQNGLFGPADNITREQMAIIMYRYAVYKGYDTTIGDTAAFDAFPDKQSVSSFSTNGVKWAVYAKLITGDGGMINPQGYATRAQCATIIMRFIEYTQK